MSLLCISEWQPKQRAESLGFVRLHLYLPGRGRLSALPERHTVGVKAPIAAVCRSAEEKRGGGESLVSVSKNPLRSNKAIKSRDRRFAKTLPRDLLHFQSWRRLGFGKRWRWVQRGIFDLA